MTAKTPRNLIESSARWALHYAKRAPRPLFATPCFYFTLDKNGLPNSESIHFVQLADAFSTPPEGMLRRAKHLRHPPGTHAAVLVYALGGDEELYNDAIAPPAHFLVYTYAPASQAAQGFLERRLVRVEGEAIQIIPDRCLAFDSRKPPAVPSRKPRPSDGGATDTVVLPTAPATVH